MVPPRRQRSSHLLGCLCFLPLLVTDIELARAVAVGSRLGGFDVRVDLVGNWQAVPARALAVEWAKQLGPLSTRKALERLAAGDAQIWLPEDGNSLPTAYASIVAANGVFAPTVEAQRASCRALIGRADPGSFGTPCSASTDFAILSDGKLVCEVDQIRAWLAADHRPNASLRQLSNDALVFSGKGSGSHDGRTVILCGCADDKVSRPLPLLAWALELEKAELSTQPLYENLRVLFRQGDCARQELTNATSHVDRLAGYGVELRIKSTEYKATVDDTESTPKDAATTSKEIAGDDDESDAETEDIEAAALKSLEGAVVLGMNLDRLAGRLPSLAPALLSFREQVEGEGPSEDLHRWEIKDLSLQAAARIHNSLDPLATWETLSGNFPGLMAALARDKVRPKLRRALGRLRHETTEYEHIIELDGQSLPNGLSLLDALHHVQPKVVALAQLGPGADTAASELDADNSNSSETNSALPRLDWRAPTLHYVYNVRNDANAEDWAQRLGALASAPKRRNEYEDNPFDTFGMGPSELFPNKPKPLPEIQQPLLTVVLVFDIMDSESLDLAVNISSTTQPIRATLVPVVDKSRDPETQNASSAASATFGSLLKNGKKKDIESAISFLSAFLKKTKESPMSSPSSRLGAALREAKKGGAKKGKDKKGASQEEEAELLRKAVIEGLTAHQASEQYVQTKGLQIPSILVNGLVVLPKQGNSLSDDLQAALRHEAEALRTAVSDKRLKDKKKNADIDKALEDLILGGGRASPLFDESLTPDLIFDTQSLPAGHEPKLPMSMSMREFSVPAPSPSTKPKAQPKLVVFSPSELAQMPRFVASSAVAGHPNLELILFITRAAAVPLISAFAKQLSSVKSSQLIIVPALAFEAEEPNEYERVLTCLAGAKHLEDLATEAWLEPGRCGSAKFSLQPSSVSAVWAALPIGDDKLATHGATVVCNGQLTPDMPVAMPSPVASLVIDKRCPQPIAGVMAGLTLAAKLARPRRRSTTFQRCDTATPRLLRVRLPRPNLAAPASLEVAAVLNPLWEGATAFAAVARLLHSQLNAEICIVLNPKEIVDEYPLKRWARHVVGWPADAGAQTKGAAVPQAVFERIQTRHTLTMVVVSPPSWLVSARASQHDLDNIRQMDAVHVHGDRPEVTATYELERLYVEGSAHTLSGAPAAGLQLELVSPDGSIEDTRVMKNRGFWSMPALPGNYELRLKDGPSSETFELVDNIHGSSSVASRALEITSLDAPLANVKVRTKADAKEGDLLKKTFGKTKRSWRRRQRRQQISAAAGQATNLSLATVHIFSVASGHLYERLLAIMILSVRRHTAAPLHFWFVDNFLSPEFKEFLLPALVDRHGGGNTAYDLVTFKWPSWLNPQTDKQRLIWAYKILFLDVLFPMDVPRIIFIDADQVVRADVQELWNLDLQDSVYGFTPFCNGKTTPLGAYVIESPPAAEGLPVHTSVDPKSSELAKLVNGTLVNVVEVSSAPVDKKLRARIEDPAGWITLRTVKGQEFAVAQSEGEERANNATRGFRFWESGYWKSHLGPKPYHISALFVVDLDEFRRRSVGDELRSTYNSLTADPNALANLDQDLPNYVQHQFSIYSLPQDWLWCESWCSNASKPLAKTIDLCQNPQTKEPKIAMAKRIIPEWEGYHREVLAMANARSSEASSPSLPESSEASDSVNEHARSEL